MNTSIINEQESFLGEADADVVTIIKRQGTIRVVKPTSNYDYYDLYSNSHMGHKVRMRNHMRRIRKNLCLS